MARLIESKSFKAYWLCWRGRGASMERLSALVADDVASATGAQSVEVIVRGPARWHRHRRDDHGWTAARNERPSSAKGFLS